MSVGFILVNLTAREKIAFHHVAATSKREIAGNPAASAIVSWYLLEHPGHQIAFVSDTYGDWPFQTPRPELATWVDATEKTVDALIDAGILEDRGRLYEDDDEPESVYIRDLRNVWTHTSD